MLTTMIPRMHRPNAGCRGHFSSPWARNESSKTPSWARNFRRPVHDGNQDTDDQPDRNTEQAEQNRDHDGVPVVTTWRVERQWLGSASIVCDMCCPSLASGQWMIRNRGRRVWRPCTLRRSACLRRCRSASEVNWSAAPELPAAERMYSCAAACWDSTASIWC